MRFSSFKFFGVLLTVAIIFSSCSEDNSEPLPGVAFEVNGGDRPAPAEVEFINNTTNADSYEWDFGDGNKSEETNPTHTFTEPGNYTVKLIATNDVGLISSTQDVYVFDDIHSWTPSRISIMENEWEAMVDTTIYTVLRHADGEVFYYNEDQTFTASEVGFDDQSTLILADFDENMELSLEDGSVKFELRVYQEVDTVDLDNDPILFEHTLTASDIIPDNNTDSYLTEVVIEDDGVKFEVEYNEAE